jgi:hypothetical protein
MQSDPPDLLSGSICFTVVELTIVPKIRLLAHSSRSLCTAAFCLHRLGCCSAA